MQRSSSVFSESWFGLVRLAVATGIGYFLLGRLGLFLRAEDVAVFWPAAGLAIGALIALGPSARLPLAAGIFVATVAHNFMLGRYTWLPITFGLLNVGQALFTAWLLERWFGRTFKLEDVHRVLGFFAATAAGSALSALGTTVAIGLIKPAAPHLHVWRLWFAACSLGVITVAPLLIGLGDVMREQLPRHELIEGWVGLVMLTALSAVLISLPDGPWATALPEALVFPFLLWIAMRCRPVFAAAAALVVGLVVIGSTTLGVGNFDLGKPLADRILSAQTFVLAAAISVVLLAAVFAERRRGGQALKQSAERLQLALAAGEVMAFHWDAITGQSVCSDNASLMLGDEHVGGGRPPHKEFLSRVHPEDRQRFKACMRQLRPDKPSYAITFRLVRPDGNQVWLEETARGEFDAAGRLLHIKGLTRDISERKRAELALTERTIQLELAGKAALVGSFAYGVDTEKMQISEGYVAIYGLPEGTAEIARSQWLARVHPDDRDETNAARSRAFSQRQREYGLEFRFVRSSGEVRWIEARSFIAYRSDGRPERMVGVNIDVTDRRRAQDYQHTLHAELDHRVKNVLATVSTVAARTMDASSSMHQFVASLDGRIRSMARTHELLSANQWQGISVLELVRRELAPYATSGNTEINGPDVTLKAEAGQGMGMVLHELVTNAAKYGALSSQNGCVSIRWRRRLNGQPQSHLVLEWQEIGGPPVVAVGKSSYGTSTIRDLIPYEFGGTVDLILAPEGVRCCLELPSDWLGNDRQHFSEAGAHASPRTGEAWN